MERKTLGKVLVSCICFLALIYALASMDRSNRLHRDDTATMAPQSDQTSRSNHPSAPQKIMYLTFDDGPSKHTQQIHNRGHALGIHTYSHSYETIYSSIDGYFQDVEKVEHLIYEKTGITTHILRFPGGSSNTISRKYQAGIMSELAAECEKRGYAYYDWNAENGDGDPAVSADALYETAIKTIKGKDEVMMLMHDGAGNGNTVQALDRILQELMAQGWEFRIIEESDDMPIFHHTIAN